VSPRHGHSLGSAEPAPQPNMLVTTPDQSYHELFSVTRAPRASSYPLRRHRVVRHSHRASAKHREMQRHGRPIARLCCDWQTVALYCTSAKTLRSTAVLFWMSWSSWYGVHGANYPREMGCGFQRLHCIVTFRYAHGPVTMLLPYKEPGRPVLCVLFNKPYL
jgi:hypothetical protein